MSCISVIETTKIYVCVCEGQIHAWKGNPRLGEYLPKVKIRVGGVGWHPSHSPTRSVPYTGLSVTDLLYKIMLAGNPQHTDSSPQYTYRYICSNSIFISSKQCQCVSDVTVCITVGSNCIVLCTYWYYLYVCVCVCWLINDVSRHLTFLH